MTNCILKPFNFPIPFATMAYFAPSPILVNVNAFIDALMYKYVYKRYIITKFFCCSLFRTRFSHSHFCLLLPRISFAFWQSLEVLLYFCLLKTLHSFGNVLKDSHANDWHDLKNCQLINFDKLALEIFYDYLMIVCNVAIS